MSTTTEKIWGTTEALIRTPLFEVHRLIIRPEMRCSFHVHKFKWNAFYVIEGVLHIDSVLSDLSPAMVETLEHGGYTTVAPGVFHQFRTDKTGAQALEVYYTEALSEDIIRRNVGGPA